MYLITDSNSYCPVIAQIIAESFFGGGRSSETAWLRESIGTSNCPSYTEISAQINPLPGISTRPANLRILHLTPSSETARLHFRSFSFFHHRLLSPLPPFLSFAFLYHLLIPGLKIGSSSSNVTLYIPITIILVASFRRTLSAQPHLFIAFGADGARRKTLDDKALLGRSRPVAGNTTRTTTILIKEVPSHHLRSLPYRYHRRAVRIVNQLTCCSRLGQHQKKNDRRGPTPCALDHLEET